MRHVFCCLVLLKNKQNINTEHDKQKIYLFDVDNGWFGGDYVTFEFYAKFSFDVSFIRFFENVFFLLVCFLKPSRFRCFVFHLFYIFVRILNGKHSFTSLEVIQRSLQLHYANHEFGVCLKLICLRLKKQI